MTPHSPLQGRAVPHDWDLMSFQAKANCVVANGWAPDFAKACRLLGKHRKAVTQQRREKMEREARAAKVRNSRWWDN